MFANPESILSPGSSLELCLNFSLPAASFYLHGTDRRSCPSSLVGWVSVHQDETVMQRGSNKALLHSLLFSFKIILLCIRKEENETKEQPKRERGGEEKRKRKKSGSAGTESHETNLLARSMGPPPTGRALCTACYSSRRNPEGKRSARCWSSIKRCPLAKCAVLRW